MQKLQARAWAGRRESRGRLERRCKIGNESYDRMICKDIGDASEEEIDGRFWEAGNGRVIESE